MGGLEDLCSCFLTYDQIPLLDFYFVLCLTDYFTALLLYNVAACGSNFSALWHGCDWCWAGLKEDIFCSLKLSGNAAIGA